MAFPRAKQRKPTTAETKLDFGVDRKVSIERVLRSYAESGEQANPFVLHQHVNAVRDVLWDAVDAYHHDVQSAQADRHISSYKLGRAEDSLNKVLESAQRINFPSTALVPLSFEFIDASLDYEKLLTPPVRQALGNMGLIIGGDRILTDKVYRIAQHHMEATHLTRKGATDQQVLCVELAENMLGSFGVSVSKAELPSVSSEVAQFAKNHARKATMAGTAALIATSILAPTAANASTLKNSNSLSTEVSVSLSETAQSNSGVSTPIGSKTQGGEKGGIVPIVSLKKSNVEINKGETLASPVESAAAPKANVVIHTDTEEAIITTAPEAIGQKESTSQQNLTVKPAIDVTVDTAPDATKKPTETIGVHEKKKTDTITLITSKITVPDPEKMVDAEGKPIVADKSPISTKPESDEVEKLDKETATPEQLAMEMITSAIKNDGDVSAAASFIREYFHDNTIKATVFEGDKPVYETTNAALVENVSGLQAAYEALISQKGHADVDYVNNGLTALAVLKALANDQSILHSPNIQELIKDIKRPDDDYKAKLFDQYVAKAKEALNAENGKLIIGVEDGYKAQLESLYSYALLANVSDEQQGKEIQAIKDAEAKAAEEAKRKAAEEAAKKEAESNGNYDKSPQAEALQNLIEREQDPAKKRTYKVFQFLLDKTDLTLPQIAGVVGNMLVESGSTMDPSIKQWGGGPGRGMVQWEGGRWINLQKFAADRGTSWDDFYTQLEFLLHELPGRQNTLEIIKGKETQVEAARTFMVLFETPYTVVRAYETGDWSDVDRESADRSSRADKYVDAIKAETGTIKNAREAAAKAEAEKKEKERIQREQEAKERAQYGPTYEEAVGLARDFFYNRNDYLDAMESPKYRVQCTALVNYFTQRYVNDSEQEGNGVDVAEFFAHRSGDYSMRQASEITPYTLFSLRGHGPGHTGMIMSVEPDGSIIVVEANVKDNIRHASGMLRYDSFGNKKVENWNVGQVNIEHWSSLNAWLNHWNSWGYSDAEFASPDNVKKIDQNFEKGSH